jgi:hypothetical protein
MLQSPGKGSVLETQERNEGGGCVRIVFRHQVCALEGVPGISRGIYREKPDAFITENDRI